MKIVIAGIIEKNEKILIAKRKSGLHLAGKWEFPGGKLEPGESPDACLKREIQEELGINIEVNNYLCSNKFNYEHISIDLQAYMAVFVSGNITLKDHDEIRWVTKKELSDFGFAEADIPIVEYLIKINYHTYS